MSTLAGHRTSGMASGWKSFAPIINVKSNIIALSPNHHLSRKQQAEG